MVVMYVYFVFHNGFSGNRFDSGTLWGGVIVMLICLIGIVMVGAFCSTFHLVAAAVSAFLVV